VLIGPAPLTPDGALPASARRDMPLEIAWTGGTRTAVVALVSQDGATGLNVRCFADASAGAMTIPTAALAELPGTVPTRIVLFTEERRVIDGEGDRQTRIVLRTTLHSGDLAVVDGT
jgi:hypothetical protein